MDSIMGRLGLSGRSFIPMILALAARARIMVPAPGEQAGPVQDHADHSLYVLQRPAAHLCAFSELFFPENALLVAYSMYLLGILVAIASAFVLHLMDRKKQRENSLLIELPEYKAPSARTIAIYVWEKVKDYLTKAGTTIFVASIIMWVLLNFGPSGYSQDLGNTFGSMIGRFIVPFFSPIGLGFWQIVVALIAASLPRKWWCLPQRCSSG